MTKTRKLIAILAGLLDGLLLIVLAGSGLLLMAQTPPGTVTVSTTITATAGTGATAVSCVLTNASGTGAISCSVNGAVVQTAQTVPMPVAAGSVVSYTANSNSVTWILQPGTVAGAINWAVAANGVQKSGTF